MSDYYLQSGRAAPIKIRESAAFWPSTTQHPLGTALIGDRFDRSILHRALDRTADMVPMEQIRDVLKAGARTLLDRRGR